MKKIYMLATAFVISITAIAQSTSHGTWSPNDTKYKMKSSPKFIRSGANRTSDGLYLNYDSAESYNSVSVNFLTYNSNWIKNMNMNYSWPADSSATSKDPIRYGIVAYDSLFDPYSFNFYSNASVTDIRVDSLFIIVGQQNLSGIDDTLVTKIVSVDANGFPTSTVLWSDMTIIPAAASLSMVSSGNNNWLYGAFHVLTPNYIVMGASRFAIRVEYSGNKLDTFGLQYGFPSFSVPTCGAATGPFDLASPTIYSQMGSSGVANSFAYHMNRGLGGAALTGKLFPTITGGFVYYNCDGVSGYSAGNDGVDYIQDFSMISYVTTNPLGITESVNNNFSLFQNKPNPFDNQTVIAYQLKKSAENVSIEIFDVRGVKMYSKTDKNIKVGKYTLDLKDVNFAAGVYFCTLTVDGQKVTNKMIKE